MRMTIYRQITNNYWTEFIIMMELSELIMGRVINTELPTIKRRRICGLIVNAIGKLNGADLNASTRNDLIAFIILSLNEIKKTLLQTTSQWEKRGYWIKSEKFLSEWTWVNKNFYGLLSQRTDEGWCNLPQEIAAISDELKDIPVLKKSTLENFWEGAFTHLSDKYKNEPPKK